LAKVDVRDPAFQRIKKGPVYLHTGVLYWTIGAENEDSERMARISDGREGQAIEALIKT
jgi:hypothetical protein